MFVSIIPKNLSHECGWAAEPIVASRDWMARAAGLRLGFLFFTRDT